MPRGKKTDSETKARILEAKINEGKQGSDIAKELNIPERTVQNILDKEFAEICGSSNSVANLIDRNNNLQSAADALIAKMIAEEHQSVTVAQLTTLRQSTFTQNQLLTGKATERVEINGYEQLESIKKGEKSIDDAYAVFNSLRSQSE